MVRKGYSFDRSHSLTSPISYPFTFRARLACDAAPQHAFERAREAVGPVMAELLETIQHHDDPILIDIALKADMVGFAAEITSAWDFQHQSKSVFTGVYKQMRRSGTQGSHASSFRPRVCIPR